MILWILSLGVYLYVVIVVSLFGSSVPLIKF